MWRPLFAVLGMTLAIPAAVAQDQSRDRFEAAARALVEGCPEEEKIMTRSPGGTRMPNNDTVVQVWTGSCPGAEAAEVTIICGAPLRATSAPQCYIKD